MPREAEHDGWMGLAPGGVSIGTHTGLALMSVFGFHTKVASFGVRQLNLPPEIFSPYPLTFSDHRISEEAWEAGSPPQ